MQKQSFDRAWRFHRIHETLKVGWGAKTDPEIEVDLPHDWSIGLPLDPDEPAGPSGGFFPTGSGLYTKTLYAPEAWRGMRVFLEFEGVYMHAVVMLNEHVLARRPYGYSTFLCELTPCLELGRDNKLEVLVTNPAPNSRWYTGSGIYRHVWLMVAPPVHLAHWGVCVTTPGVAPERSLVRVATTVENTAAPVSGFVRTTVIDAGGGAVAAAETPVDLAGGRNEVAQELAVAPARLWSVEDPYLYRLKSELVLAGETVDTAETAFGIRSIEIDAAHGLRLNGRPLKLRGGCLHHDCGLLGAAAHDRAEERKVELLKASGYNAVRTAHNPPSPAFLDACDRLGMLVMDEAFDDWRHPALPNGYHLYFDDWAEKDLTDMILRDRNHPSVIFWSTGNEIHDRTGICGGYETARRLADLVRSLDPTRPVTNAVNTVRVDGQDRTEEMTRAFIEPLDVVGYNYRHQYYDEYAVKAPGRVIVGTESAPRLCFEVWEAVNRHPAVLGDFVWTAWDYLGEAGIGRVRVEEHDPQQFWGEFPWHQAFCGDLDICGFKRLQSHYRDILWGVRDTPCLAVHVPRPAHERTELMYWAWHDVAGHWNWPGHEGRDLAVDVYADADEVELFLNGRSLGRRPAGRAAGLIASFSAPYEPGELRAAAIKGGAVRECVLRTAGPPAALRLTPDRDRLRAAAGDLSFVAVELLDARGVRVPADDREITFSVCGAGRLLAVGSGDPRSTERYTGNRRRTFEGRCMAVVGTTGEGGAISLTAVADGLPAAVAALWAE
ncbi:MAG: glycoside hydrolase family 2 TIM barrel-domain containing protein [Patescibacteria group bacterium]